MLQRLEKVQPVYRITDWIDDWRRSEELTQRITAYPAPSPTRSKSACQGTRSATPGGLDQSEGGSKEVTTTDIQGDLEISDVPPDTEKQLDTT